MPLTNAEKQNSYRARRTAKLERYEAALCRIADADDVTLMCDPLGSKRIARDALTP